MNEIKGWECGRIYNCKIENWKRMKETRKKTNEIRSKQ